MPLPSLCRPPASLPSAASARVNHVVASVPISAIVLGATCSRTASRPFGVSRQQCRRVAMASAAAVDADSGLAEDVDDDVNDDEDIGLGTSGTFDESSLGPLPEVRHQEAMGIKDRKAWRAKAGTLAREKRLMNIQVGQLGITPSFLRAAADILEKHSLMRVKLGEGCGLERGEAADILERYLDCVCVHQIGFTVTLYRKAGLPRPSNTLREERVAADAAAVAAREAAAAAAAKAAREKEARKKLGQQTPKERPPEFSVLK